MRPMYINGEFTQGDATRANEDAMGCSDCAQRHRSFLRSRAGATVGN